MRRSPITTTLAFAAIALAARGAAAQDVGLELGTSPAPVVLEDLDGKAIDLAQWIGKKPVVLEFWATWCPVCKALEPKLAAARKKYGDRIEVVVVAVGVNQTPRSVKRHLEKHEMPGTLVWDGKGKAVRAFEAPGTSYVVVLDAKGKVTYTGMGEDQDLEKAIAKVITN